MVFAYDAQKVDRRGGEPDRVAPADRSSRRSTLAVVLIDVQAVLVAIPGLALVALVEQRPRAFSMPLLGEHPTSQAWAWGLVLVILAAGLVVLGIEARAGRSGAVIGLYVAELLFAGSALLALSPQRGVIGLLTAVTVVALIASDRHRERRTGPQDRVGSADGVGTLTLPSDAHRHENGLVTTPRRAPTAMTSPAPCP